MKKVFAVLLSAAIVFGMTACEINPADIDVNALASQAQEIGGEYIEQAQEVAGSIAEAVNEAITDYKTEGTMTHGEYIAADIDSPVVIETYVQAHQSWWDNTITCYTQDKTGGYFLYNMACSEEDAEKLVPGTKIKVTGYKSEWSGEVEVIDATFEIEDGSFIAGPMNLTDALDDEDLIKYQNVFAAFKGLTVAPSQDADGNDVAFLYNWDGSGEPGSDLYFNVALGDDVYNFCVESYLCGADTDVYKAVEALEIGDVIDIEGFLYWYNGPQPHVTKVTAAE